MCFVNILNTTCCTAFDGLFEQQSIFCGQAVISFVNRKRSVSLGIYSFFTLLGISGDYSTTRIAKSGVYINYMRVLMHLISVSVKLLFSRQQKLNQNRMRSQVQGFFITNYT